MIWKKEDRIRIFPKQVDNSFQGYKIAAIIFLLLTFVTIARSCIHILAPDGGAGSIAGINVSGEGGSNVISLFALWGLSQLLMGFVYLVVFFSYKSLIPFMYLLILAEYSGRIVLGFIKPLEVSHTPPGAIGDYIMVPLAVLMLILSLKKPKKKTDNE
jgi:predicted neutral ceramidase superfamily lipid hydrolase